MKTHSRSNNLIAILIAVLLFAIGFVLYFVHEQRESERAMTAANELPAIAYQLSSPATSGPLAGLHIALL
mgnify:CR=1 FL=1